MARSISDSLMSSLEPEGLSWASSDIRVIAWAIYVGAFLEAASRLLVHNIAPRAASPFLREVATLGWSRFGWRYISIKESIGVRLTL